MKLTSKNWFLALCACALFAGAVRSPAQGFGLSVTTDTNAVTVNNPVTFTIQLTNLTGIEVSSVLVSNTLSGSASARVTDFTATQGTVLTNDNLVRFNLGPLLDGGIAQMTLTVRPRTSGLLTNTT